MGILPGISNDQRELGLWFYISSTMYLQSQPLLSALQESRGALPAWETLVSGADLTLVS